MSMTMPFGKHKDEPIASIPLDYLRWTLESAEIRSPALRAAIEARVNGAGDDDDDAGAAAARLRGEVTRLRAELAAMTRCRDNALKLADEQLASCDRATADLDAVVAAQRRVAADAVAAAYRATVAAVDGAQPGAGEALAALELLRDHCLEMLSRVAVVRGADVAPPSPAKAAPSWDDDDDDDEEDD